MNLNSCKAEDDVCLILTQSYQPIGVTSARESIRKLMSKNKKVRAIDRNGVPHTRDSWLEHAELFDDHPCLSSAHRPYPIPTILITNHNYFFKRKLRAVSLKMLYRYFRGVCQICGKEKPISAMSKEHIKPRSKGGSNEPSNLTLTCKRCNQKKDNIFPYLKADLKSIEDVHTGEIHLLRPEWSFYVGKGINI